MHFYRTANGFRSSNIPLEGLQEINYEAYVKWVQENAQIAESDLAEAHEEVNKSEKKRKAELKKMFKSGEFGNMSEKAVKALVGDF